MHLIVNNLSISLHEVTPIMHKSLKFEAQILPFYEKSNVEDTTIAFSV